MRPTLDNGRVELPRMGYRSTKITLDNFQAKVSASVWIGANFLYSLKAFYLIAVTWFYRQIHDILFVIYVLIIIVKEYNWSSLSNNDTTLFLLSFV